MRMQSTYNQVEPELHLILNLLGRSGLVRGVVAIIRRSADSSVPRPNPQAPVTKSPYLPGDILRPDNRRASHRIRAQQHSPATALTRGQGHQVVHHAATKDPVAHGAGGSKAEAGQDFDRQGRCGAFEEGGGGVVQEVENADAGEGLGDNVGEQGRGRVCVHGAEFGSYVVELGEGIDGDEDVGDVETFGVPEDHPCWPGMSAMFSSCLWDNTPRKY